MTDSSPVKSEPISRPELEKLQNALKINRQKQGKLTDAFLDSLLSEEVFKAKNEDLRAEEEELQRRVALQEFHEIERERSADYLNRVEEFVSGYDPECKELNSDTQKQILHLLFKNIKIARKDIFSFEFFSPFKQFGFETPNFQNFQINQKDL